MPLADLEMIFPDKRVYLKPLLLLQLFVTILIGTISVFVTFLTVIVLPLGFLGAAILQKIDVCIWNMICQHETNLRLQDSHIPGGIASNFL